MIKTIHRMYDVMPCHATFARRFVRDNPQIKYCPHHGGWRTNEGTGAWRAAKRPELVHAMSIATDAVLGDYQHMTTLEEMHRMRRWYCCIGAMLDAIDLASCHPDYHDG